MAVSGNNSFNVYNSSDSSEYKAVFYMRAMQLIIAGANNLRDTSSNLNEYEETEITGEITRCVDEYINNFDSPEWTSQYTIKEESYEHSDKLGKYRKRVDIVVTLSGRKPQLPFRFEAKRLKETGWPTNGYVGKEGLGEFISSNYAKDDKVAGMLGYVQSNTCFHWADKVSAEISTKKKQIRLRGNGSWKKVKLDGYEHCYQTVHNKTNGEELLMYHLLLDFTS